MQTTELYCPPGQEDQNTINGGEDPFTASTLPAKHLIHHAQHQRENDVHQHEHPILFAAGAAAKPNVIT